MKTGRWIQSAILLALGGMLISAAWSQTVIPAIPSDGQLSVEQIDTAIAAVEAQEGLDEVTRNRVLDQLRDAQAQIQNRRAAETAAAAFAGAVETAPQETAAIQQQLAEAAPPAPTAESLGISPTMSLAELQQLLARESATLTGAESRGTELRSQLETQEGRPEQARQRIGELRQARDELDRQAGAEPPSGQPQILTDATRLAATLRRDAQTAEINRLEQELLSHSVRMSRLNVERDLTLRAINQLRQRVAVIEAAVNERRQVAALEAQQQAELTELASADRHPVVRRLAEGNAELTRELPEIAAEIDRATASVRYAQDEARELEQGLARSRQRLEIAGISQIIGQLFVEERRNLPKVSQFRGEVRDRRKALTRIGLAQVRIEEQRRELTTLNASIDTLMDEIAVQPLSQEELEETEQEIGDLLQNRRELLQQVAGTYSSYLQVLSDLDVAQRRLLRAADDYQAFLDQNLLWIPSTSIANVQTLRDLAPAAVWVLSPVSWIDVGYTFGDAVLEYPFWAFVALVLLSLLLAALRPLKVRFKALGQKVGQLSTDHIGLTLAGLGMVAVRALPLPLGLAIVGTGLVHSPSSTEFATAVAASLFAIGPFLYNVNLYRNLCARDGVARIHFGYPEAPLQRIRRELDRLAFVGGPLVFFTVIVLNSSSAVIRNSLGRVLFIALMIFLSVVIARLFAEPEGGGRRRSETHGFQVSVRFRKFWFYLGTGGPILLALLSLVGYQYTAAILIGQLVDTFFLVIALFVANLVMMRWLSVERRKIAHKLALEKFEESRDKPQVAGQEVEGEVPVPERKPIDLDAVDQQTRRLLRAGTVSVAVLGLWGIWSDVLPALIVLDQVALWSQTVTVDGQETIQPVTMADLLAALVIVAVTYVASRNLPGLMEIAVLQRLTLQPGSRYAIITLVRYVVVTVGVIMVLGIVGWNWGQIQWLVAALSVGLGFGLQEIVANFVSGLVILFERPIRVGDTVTVGNLTGTVSRVRIRATTITDWDRKEILVPNKSFITEQVVNWTLSDPITRIVVPVGISYGSDVKLAHRVMQDTLRSMPLVLEEPEPQVYFMGFGESSLDFNLYLYSRQLSDRLPLMHAVHEEILTALRENGIEIPFPQRDLHVRSVDDGVSFPTGSGTDNRSDDKG